MGEVNIRLNINDSDIFIMRRALYRTNRRNKSAEKYKAWLGCSYGFAHLVIGQSAYLFCVVDKCGHDFLRDSAFEGVDIVTSPVEKYEFDEDGVFHLYTKNTEYLFDPVAESIE